MSIYLYSEPSILIMRRDAQKKKTSKICKIWQERLFFSGFLHHNYHVSLAWQFIEIIICTESRWSSIKILWYSYSRIVSFELLMSLFWIKSEFILVSMEGLTVRMLKSLKRNYRLWYRLENSTNVFSLHV